MDFLASLPALLQSSIIAGTNTTDLSSYLQTALNTHPVVELPYYNLQIANTIILNPNQMLRGPMPVRQNMSGLNGTCANLIAPSGLTVLQLGCDSLNHSYNTTLANLAISGGLIGLNMTPASLLANPPHQAFNIQVLDSYFYCTGPGSANFQSSTCYERCTFARLDLGRADYGFQFISNSNKNYNYFDKNLWDQINIFNANMNGFNLQASRVCNSNVMRRINLQSCKQTAFWSSCTFSGLLIESPDTEANGTPGVTTTDEFYFGAQSQQIQFVNAVNMAMTSPSAPIRYFINNSGASSVTLYNSSWSQPIQDWAKAVITYVCSGPIVT